MSLCIFPAKLINPLVEAMAALGQMSERLPRTLAFARKQTTLYK
jgi:hypothetical protein